MSDVKRYDPINKDGTCGVCVEDADYGAYVEYADYAVLEAVLDRFKVIADNYYAQLADANAELAMRTNERNGLRMSLDTTVLQVEALQAELAQLRAGQEPVDTVPKWRYDALIKHAKHQDKVIAKLQDEKNTAWLYEQKEVWFWQGDGEDYPESLCCPVVIKADDLRAILAASGPQPSAGPDGFVIVPIQPTEEMRKRAQDYLATEGMIVSDWLVHTVYTKMLAAAPSAPATVQGVNMQLLEALNGMLLHIREPESESEFQWPEHFKKQKAAFAAARAAIAAARKGEGE